MQADSSLECKQKQAVLSYVWQIGKYKPHCQFRSDMRQVISWLVMVSYDSPCKHWLLEREFNLLPMSHWRVRRNIQTSITHTSLTLSTKEFKPQLHCLHLEVTRSNLASLRRHCLDSQQQVALLAWVVFSYLFMSFNGVLSVSCASVCALYELVWNFTIAYIKCSFAKHYF